MYHRRIRRHREVGRHSPLRETVPGKNYPYGDSRIEETSATFHNDYTYTGKERDEDTALLYYEARYYDSHLGRFISLDTWSGDINDPQSLNKYAYVRNNPLKYVDPDGAAFIDFLEGYVEQTFDDIDNAINDVIDIASNPKESFSAAKESAEQIVNTVSNAVENPKQAASAAWSTVTETVSGTYDALMEADDAGRGAIAAGLLGGLWKKGTGFFRHSPDGKGPNFLVTPGGNVIPIPQGAVNTPLDPNAGSGTGLQFKGGSGGNGLAEGVSNVRIMDANSSQGDRVIYTNSLNQPVNPQTGKPAPPHETHISITIENDKQK